MLIRDATYEQAVSAWAAHLRAGGTTDWSAWRDTATSGAADLAADPPAGGRRHPLPDAVHLELVRRINLAAPADEDVRGLADRVLATAAPGRGLLDVPLPWSETPRRFGTPPMDPARLPEEELIRLAVGVLAHLLPDVPHPTPDLPSGPWPLPWRRRFRLHGSPGTAARVRESLLGQGLVETDWRTTHVVLARPVPAMMAEWWAASVRDGGILKWSTAWRRAEAAGRLPASVDVSGIAAHLAGRTKGQVHVVVASGAAEAAALTAGILRTEPAEVREDGDPAVSDLLRRLNRLTVLAHGHRSVRELARTLAATLAQAAIPAHPATSLAPPPPSMGWAQEQAASTAESIRRSGYAVHGDLDALTPPDHRLPGTVDRGHTLELAVTACLRSWHLRGSS
jgi:hypothetical protein